VDGSSTAFGPLNSTRFGKLWFAISRHSVLRLRRAIRRLKAEITPHLSTRSPEGSDHSRPCCKRDKLHLQMPGDFVVSDVRSTIESDRRPPETLPTDAARSQLSNGVLLALNGALSAEISQAKVQRPCVTTLVRFGKLWFAISRRSVAQFWPSMHH